MTLQFSYRVVDVFTDRPLAGNALCVVDDPVPEPVMPAIAREVNLSETVFVTTTGADRYAARIFSPDLELPFPVHPTLGPAWTLGPGKWQQRTTAGVVAVEVDEVSASMVVPEPALTPVEDDGHQIAAACGLPAGALHGPAVIGESGIRHLVVPTEH